MIRRWTFVNKLNFFYSSLFLTERFSSYRSFKRNIRFKKFSPIFTKRRRHQITRLKETSSSMIYSQILGHWATDYQNKLSICRFQYMHQIAPLHFIGVNAMNFQKPTVFE